MRRLLRKIMICLFIIGTLPFLFITLKDLETEVRIYHIQNESRTRHFQHGLSLRRVDIINCRAIIENDEKEIEKAKQLMESHEIKPENIMDAQYVEMTRNCDSFRLLRGYINYNHVTEEERDFPIAYSILLYKDVSQAERLLRAIYRPQNIYCFHVDAYSKSNIHKAVQAIANCFPNVFVVSRKEFVVYAGYSRLQADLNCMTDLLQSKVSWKYFINLPSQQFPIKTNAEIVKILKIYNGSNDIEGKTGSAVVKGRIRYHHFYKYSNIINKVQLFRSEEIKDDPPLNITIVKGSAYGIFSRAMVRYICEDKIARVVLDYLRDVRTPDEYYWATLNHNPHIEAPGSYKGNPNKKPWLASYSKWIGPRRNESCEGVVVHKVCVYGVGDIHALVDQKYLFVNKFFQDIQPLALQCMEEWYFNKTLTNSWSTFDTSYYKTLPFINK